MISQLAALLETEQVPSDPAGFVRALELLDRLDARLHMAAGALDAAGSWADEGAVDFAAFVAWKGRRSRRAANRLASMSKKLRQLPVLGTAWCDGALSRFQVEVVLANVGRHVELFASHEAEVVPALAALGPKQTVAAMAEWRRRADALCGDDEAPEASSELYLSETLDGRHEISGHLCAEDGAVVAAAIEVASSAGGEATAFANAAQRRADALVGICRSYLAGREVPATRRQRAHLSVLVRYEDLVAGGPGRRPDGMVVSPSDVARTSCDSVLHRLVYSRRSSILDFGSATRVISDNLWAALVARDGHCRHPGCDRPPGWCEAHHVVHFSQGGLTRLSNLVLACARHHHIWHDQDWRLELFDEAVLELVSPGGQVLQSKPPPLDFLLT